MNSEIFREYDIRGIAGKDITDDDVTLIGKGIGTFLYQHGSSKITVGQDCRVTSGHYTGKLIEGLR
ncbi:MAG: phosphomannomutase, partial [Desulfobacteraceae bacterium]|nr:phosphomannomutase [Desulfobacteraceae bacterium]